MNSICERLQSFLKTQDMHTISPVTFVSTCDYDANHLVILEPEHIVRNCFSNDRKILYFTSYSFLKV